MALALGEILVMFRLSREAHTSSHNDQLNSESATRRQRYATCAKPQRRELPGLSYIWPLARVAEASRERTEASRLPDPQCFPHLETRARLCWHVRSVVSLNYECGRLGAAAPKSLD
jgi:hypothetical protein